MRPICIKCHVTMRPHKTGADIEIMMDRERPYQIFSGDVFRCPGCGCEIATQFGANPIAEHHDRERYAKFQQGIYARAWDRVEDVPAPAKEPISICRT